MKNNNNLVKRLLSWSLALSLGTTGTALAGTTKNGNTASNKAKTCALVMQEENKHEMNINDFANGIGSSLEYLNKFISYDHMQQDLQCLYFLTNIDYIPAELRDELISKGVIYNANLDAQEGLKNFMNAFNLINMIADYNQSRIREVNDKESIIDVSNICFDEHDAELVNNMHENYFNAYKNGMYDSMEFSKVFRQLTTLNAYEKEGNAYELSTGARWLSQNSIGGGVMQMLRDDMQKRFDKETLYKYFKREELNRAQWFMRDDLELDINCLSDEELEVFMFGQLWQFVYTDVNKDIFKYFEVNGKNICK